MKRCHPRDPCDGLGELHPKAINFHGAYRASSRICTSIWLRIVSTALTTAALSDMNPGEVYLSDEGICRYGGKNEAAL